MDLKVLRRRKLMKRKKKNWGNTIKPKHYQNNYSWSYKN